MDGVVLGLLQGGGRLTFLEAATWEEFGGGDRETNGYHNRRRRHPRLEYQPPLDCLTNQGSFR